MAANVWMGTRGSERWLKAPAPSGAFQATGWSALNQQRNGRVNGRTSRSTHMVYNLSWPTADRDTARQLSDMYYGVHGDGLIHWIDPTIDNQLPAHWSYPGLGCVDGPVIYGTSRPASAVTAANPHELPARSAVFTRPFAGYVPPSMYLPIPPGYAAHIGVHGVASAGALIARPMNDTTPVGAAAIIPTLAASSATRFSTVVTQTGSVTGIELRLALGETVGSTTLPTSATIAGMMVEVLPVGQTPRSGGYRRGEGNSGCRMFDPPVEAPISSIYDMVSVSAVLTEVGP
jgi:hypothetical protein